MCKIFLCACSVRAVKLVLQAQLDIDYLLADIEVDVYDFLENQIKVILVSNVRDFTSETTGRNILYFYILKISRNNVKNFM